MTVTAIDTRPETIAIWVNLLRNSPHGLATLGPESRQHLADLLDALCAQAAAQSTAVAFLADAAEESEEAWQAERARLRDDNRHLGFCLIGLSTAAIASIAIAAVLS